MRVWVEKVFASRERVSGFLETGLTSGEVRADLRGSPGWPPGKSGELPGKSGKLPGNPWIAVKFHSERTSGEVAEKLPGKFGELPGKSGDFPEARGGLTPSQRLAQFVSKCGLTGKCERNLGEYSLPLHYESESEKNPQIFICNRFRAEWPKSRDATAMYDAIRIAHPQIASDAKKFFLFDSDAKTHSLDLKSQENARKKTSCKNPAMLACDAKNRGVF